MVRKLIIIGILLVVTGIGGLVIAHHYRPLPPGYFMRGVPGAPTRLSSSNYDLVTTVAVAAIVGSTVLLCMAAMRFWRRRA